MPEIQTHDDRCSGIVLAGGQSRRMGRDKALLEYGGSTLLQHQVETLAQVCDHVVVSGDYPDYDCLHDSRPSMGPLSGMHSAARQFSTSSLLFLPVDMPAMTPLELRKLMAFDGPCHFDGQPMPCYFSDASKVMMAIERIWRSSEVKNAVITLHCALGSFAIRTADDSAFRNINSPEQWQDFQSVG
jgi:molybdopterin-guanine dinucleotide biosynthesis protein A